MAQRASGPGWFFWLSRVEGLSLLVLMGICMPLKYMAGIPEPVKMVGWVHGILFMTLVAALVFVSTKHKWGPLATGLCLVASVIPFGPYVWERWAHGEIEESQPA